MSFAGKQNGTTGVTKVGGGDGGAQLTVADGVALRETCTGEATNDCCDNDRGAPELPPKTWEEQSMTARQASTVGPTTT